MKDKKIRVSSTHGRDEVEFQEENLKEGVCFGYLSTEKR
jgi:hypothetical protein